MSSARGIWTIAGQLALVATFAFPAAAQDRDVPVSVRFKPAAQPVVIPVAGPSQQSVGVRTVGESRAPLMIVGTDYAATGFGAVDPSWSTEQLPEGDIVTSAADAHAVGGGQGRGIFGWLSHRWQYHTKPRLQASHWGYPEEFQEAPLGYYVYANMNVQVTKGLAAQMVMYHYDFIPEDDKLTHRGHQQLRKLARGLVRDFYPLIIEQTPGRRELDEARRRYVLAELERMHMPVPGEWVRVGLPSVEGMRGEEAQLIDLNLLRQTQAGGAGAGFGSPVSGSGVEEFVAPAAQGAAATGGGN